MDLIAYARTRLSESHDWKRDTARAYRRWLRDQTDEARRDAIVLAISPGIWYVAYRYTNPGFTREDAFEIGMCYVAKSLSHFNPQRSPRGVDEIASYLMWGAELAMMSGAKAGLQVADSECSLDDYEDPSWMVGATHERYDGRASVEDVVRDAISSLPPSDGRIAQWRLLDEMTWDEVLSHASDAGDSAISSRWGIILRFDRRIRPRIAEALRRAGYDESDV